MRANSKLRKAFKLGSLFLWFLGIFLLVSSEAYSNQIDKQKFTGATNIFGKQLTLSLTEHPQLDYKVESSKLYIKIGIGDLYKLGDSYDFALSLKLNVYEGGNQTELPDNINLNNANPEIIYAYNYSGVPDLLESVGVMVEDNINWDLVPINVSVDQKQNVIDYIKNNLTIELKSEIDYRIDVRKLEQSVAPILNPIGDDELTNRYQVFSWADNTPENFPNYQFELLRLYNTDNQLENKTKEIATTIDWSKALRIETQSSDKQLAITIAEGTGFYVWRVRPIGTFYEGGIADDRNWGEWSYAPAQGEQIVNLSLSDISAPYYFYFEDPDDDKNWIYSRTFSENNRVSEQISYANGLQQLRQSQTYLNSKDTSLITQTILDFSGRPSLTTIPVPVEGGLQPYKTQLVTTNGNLYTAENFDNNNLVAAQIDSSESYAYYSDNNTTNLSIPSSQGYPFTRVVYANDPTGRVIEQSGAGRRHALGNQSDGMGRTTRTIYGNPSVEELVRIFGDEAPRADAVLKTTTIDPNNQASVTYTSKEGNVIATCLVVNENENMVELDEYVLTENIINSKTTRNVFTGDKFISSKNLTISKETELSIEYFIDCNLIKLPCKDASGNCMYKVHFLLINLETKDLYRSNPFNVCNGVMDNETIDDQADSWKWTKDNGELDLSIDKNKITLPAGKYMVSKVVSVGATEETFEVTEAFRDSKLMIRPLTNVIHNWLNSVKREEDMYRFYEVVKEFATAINEGDLEKAKKVSDDVLGGVTMVDEFVLNENHLLYFDQDYVEATTTTKAKIPRVLTLEGGCCGAIKIPVIYLPPIKCYTVIEMKEDVDTRPDFWGYFIDAMYSHYKSELNDLNWYVGALETIPDEGKDLMSGYNENQLNTMIYYMLTDEYKISPKDEESEVQYTCNELWEAWQSVINSTNDILSGMDSIAPVSVDDGAKEEDDLSDEDGSKDDHMDDDDSADMPGGFIMRWILKKSMSGRANDFENVGSDEGSTPVDVDFDIVSQFLRQVGYKFAAIVETDADVLSIDLIGDPEYDGKKDPRGVNNILYNDIEVCNLEDSCLDNMPYIKNPVYAFKYFQYDNEKDIGRERFYQVEIQHCYYPSSAYYNKIGESVLCDYNCPYHHDEWNYKKRFRFYQDLVNYELPDYDDSDDLPEGEDFDNLLRTEAFTYFDNLKSCDICNDQEKLATIRRGIEQTFIDNCYTIGGCPTDENVVLPEDIDQILYEIKINCINNCNGIFTTVNEGATAANPYPNYPDSISSACWTLDENALDFIKQDGKKVFVILPPDAWEEYSSLKNREVSFALDDTESLCECKDDFSGNILSSEWHIIDKDTRKKTDLYPYYYQLNFDINSELDPVQDEFVGIWTEEIKGNFDISIKVLAHESGNDASQVGLFAAIDTSYLSSTGDNGDIIVSVPKEGDKIEINVDGVVTEVDAPGISGSIYWLRLVKNFSDDKFYVFYKLNEEDEWPNLTPVNSVGIDGPVATDYKIGIYAKGLQGFTNQETGIEYPGKAIFDEFNCGKLLPNQLEKDNWIGGEHPEYYYPE